jgi:hypothetical protein
MQCSIEPEPQYIQPSEVLRKIFKKDTQSLETSWKNTHILRNKGKLTQSSNENATFEKFKTAINLPMKYSTWIQRRMSVNPELWLIFTFWRPVPPDFEGTGLFELGVKVFVSFRFSLSDSEAGLVRDFRLVEEPLLLPWFKCPLVCTPNILTTALLLPIQVQINGIIIK